MIDSESRHGPDGRQLALLPPQARRDLAEPPRGRSLLRSTVVAAALAYTALVVLLLAIRPGSSQFDAALSNIGQLLSAVFAGISAAVYARFGSHESKTQRTGWLLIGLGCLSFAAGQVIWVYYETICGKETPFPSLADAGYTGAYPLLIAGILLFSKGPRRDGRAHLFIDSIVASSSAGILSWHYLVGPLWRGSHLSLGAKLIGMTCPLGDVAILVSIVVLVRSLAAGSPLRRALYLLAAGAGMLVLADSAFVMGVLHSTYHTGYWSDGGWILGWMTIGLAALGQPRARPANAVVAALATTPPATTPPANPSILWTCLPYIIAIGAFVLVGTNDFLVHGHVDGFILATGGGLILLVILRQVMTMVENRRLALELMRLNQSLEHLVEMRTEQLGTLNRLTREVSNTLQVEEVLGAAVAHTRRALRADAIILRLRETDSAGNTCYRIYHHEGLADHPDVVGYLNSRPPCERVEVVPLPGRGGDPNPSGGAALRAPLRCQGQTIGSIGSIRWDGRFGQTDPEMIESIGLEVGAAVENARLYGAAVAAADRDPVTGLYNHRAIHQRIDRALGISADQGRPMAVVMMDIDNFKLFNDTYGHPVGDQVLKRVAQVLEGELREGDLSGRYGGDEFILALPDADAEQAAALSIRLQERFRQESFIRDGDDRVIPLSLSFGLATYPEDGCNRHELITAADANLYIAKQSYDNIVQTSAMTRANRSLRGYASFDLLDGMVTAVDNKDSYTRKHSEDVTGYALWIAEELRLSEETKRTIRIGGLLHDVGKISVPDEILRKPGKLTADEFEVLKRHTTLGEGIVRAAPGMEAIVELVRSHHERWDGKGYPDGLAGAAIPYLGRLMAVADAFSAMTTDRPYRRALSFETAVAEIRDGIGTQFDPEIAQAFLRAARKPRGASTDRAASEGPLAMSWFTDDAPLLAHRSPHAAERPEPSAPRM